MTTLCDWCHEAPAAGGGRFCSKRCRQTAWRLRRRSSFVDPRHAAGRFAYADPPYPGTARKYYGGEASYAGEVDHRALIERLNAGGYLGWALSTSAAALGDVLPLVPAGYRLGAWVKPIGISHRTYGSQCTWEPVIVWGGRPARPPVRDWLRAQPARGGGSLMGRKPVAFCAWLFRMLGMRPGDELDDLFPGTGVVARSWAELSRWPRVAPRAATPRAPASSGDRPTTTVDAAGTLPLFGSNAFHGAQHEVR